MTENQIAEVVVNTCYEIHTTLGPGLFESVYEEILAYELGEKGLRINRQQAIPLVWKNIHMDIGFRADLIIEGKVIIEVKSIETIAPVHPKQLLTYLRLTDKKLGLLINFNEAYVKDGIKRVANDL